MKLPHNVSRIEALSDAIFAFAATLLVVNLDLDGDLAFFEKGLFQFTSFFISFFVLIMIWKVHYDFFRRTDYMDNWILTLNCIFLFLVLYFIFPLKSLIGTFFNGSSLSRVEVAHIFLMYGVGFTLLFLCISLMYLRAYKKSDRTENKLKQLEKSRHFGIFVIVGSLSILISSTGFGMRYGLAGFVYCLIGPLSYFNAVWFNKKHGINSKDDVEISN